MKSFLFVLLYCASFALYSQTIEVKGTVFVDKNGNNIKDAEEYGVANVTVSDQVNSTITNSQGNFILKSNSDLPYIFIVQPSEYSGKFYYKISPTVNFPIQKTKSQKEFKFIHASDVHIDSLNLPRMQRFRKMADSVRADFVIISGDLIRDALRVNETTASNYYKMFVNEINKFTMPVYCGVGNHELFGIERDKSMVSIDHPLYGKKMYQHYLGPNYYAFNYGGIHFISIDAMSYQDMYYFGGVDSVQLTWLENELKYVSSNTPIITFNHIPFVSSGFSFQDFEEDKFYGPQLLKQDNKQEHRHIVYNAQEVLARIGQRPYPLALSGHYHAAQKSEFIGSLTVFAQTSAIAGPNNLNYFGFKVQSGFTLYEVSNTKITSSKFIPLTLK